MARPRARSPGDLLRYLALQGPEPSSALDICRYLDISQPTLSRLVSQARDQILVAGRARATRYAARRQVEGLESPLAIYEIGDDATRKLAAVHPIQPRGFYVEPLTPDAPSGFFPDLPWFLHDLRPSGFLGSSIRRLHPTPDFPADVRFWSADHVLRYMSAYGWNPVGSLILGEDALKLYLQGAIRHPDAVPEDERAARYAQLAEAPLLLGFSGSFAGGEQPKFLAIRLNEGVPTSVLVKFSAPMGGAAGRRMADLLVCEHLALETLQGRGQPAARSALLSASDRIFLEVERFDRVGACGRRGVISLEAVEAEFIGDWRRWSHTTAALLSQGLISEESHLRARWLELFGRLIGDTDMHPANLSFYLRGGSFREIAPAYDMLPMFYAPRGAELPERDFDPPLPSPADADIWEEARGAAEAFWGEAAAHPWISPGFQAIARENREKIAALRPLVALLPSSGR